MKTALKVLGIAGLLLVAGFIGLLWHLGLFDRMAFAGPYGAQTKGNLGSIRSALSIYYGDLEGVYPERLELIVNPRWLTKLPPAQTKIHADSTEITPIDGQQYDARQIPDTGGWFYVTTGVNQGNVGVACTHTDSKGSIWNGY